MAQSLYVVVLGDDQRGIISQMPTFPPSTSAFPLAISCPSRDTAEKLTGLQDIVEELDRSLPAEELSVAVSSSLAVARIVESLDPPQKWYAIVRGHKPGIYPTWDGRVGASMQVGTYHDFPIHRKFSTLLGALVFTITKGADKGGDSILPATPTSTPSTPRRIGFGQYLSSPTQPRQFQSTPTTPKKNTLFTPTTPKKNSPSAGRSLPRASTSSRAAQSHAEYPWSDDTFVSVNSSHHPPIYSHIRNLRGVVGSLARPCSSQLQEVVPSLGSHADKFLTAFGFQTSAKWQIFHAQNDAKNVDEFVDILMNEGMAQTEAEWLWSVVNM